MSEQQQPTEPIAETGSPDLEGMSTEQLEQTMVGAATPVEIAPEIVPEPVAAAEPVAPVAAPIQAPEIAVSTLENGQVEYRLATGQVYRGKDHADAANQMAKAQLEASRYIQQLKQAPVAPVASLVPAPTPAASEIDASTMALIDLIAPAFDVKNGQEMIAAWKQSQQRAAEAQTLTQDYQSHQTAVNFLKTTPDFVNTPTNSEKLDAELNRLNMPFTVENAQLVHYALKGRGLYETIPAPIAAATPVNRMPPPPVGSAPANTGKAPTESELYSMSTAQLEALMSELALAGE